MKTKFAVLMFVVIMIGFVIISREGFAAKKAKALQARAEADLAKAEIEWAKRLGEPKMATQGCVHKWLHLSENVVDPKFVSMPRDCKFDVSDWAKINEDTSAFSQLAKVEGKKQTTILFDDLREVCNNCKGAGIHAANHKPWVDEVCNRCNGTGELPD